MSNQFWWTGDPEQDPLDMAGDHCPQRGGSLRKVFSAVRQVLSAGSGFRFLPTNRRDGYDFDARWEDELANIRHKKIMDCFPGEEEYMGLELKRKCGFGKDGYKNFEGMITELQMQTYLIVRDFRRKRNKRGGGIRDAGLYLL